MDYRTILGAQGTTVEASDDPGETALQCCSTPIDRSRVEASRVLWVNLGQVGFLLTYKTAVTAQ